jgi:putative lipoic acid-binding regulatory protein
MALMDDDKAGPLVGWSLGAVADADKRPLQELVAYPCVFRFKAVARVDVGVVVDMIARVSAVLGRPIGEDAWTTRDSSGGRYTCVTLDLYVTSGQQVYAVYEALRADARVTHLL